MHKQWIKDIVAKKDVQDLEDLGWLLCKALDRLKELDKSEYDDIEGDLYVVMYGEHLCEAMANKAVAALVNEDGTKGEHWTFAETSNVAKSNGITFTHFNGWDWYYVLNMMYSDYYKVFGTDTSTYLRLAKAWLSDVDVPEGKAYRYYTEVVCCSN